MDNVPNPGTQAHYEMYCDKGGNSFKYGDLFGIPEELVERLRHRSAEKACEELRNLIENGSEPNKDDLFWPFSMFPWLKPPKL